MPKEMKLEHTNRLASLTDEQTNAHGVDSEEYVVPGLQNRRILSSPIRDLEVHGGIIVKEKRNG
jgi:hypothetical protein